MNIIDSKLKILRLSYYLLGKIYFKICIKQEYAVDMFKEFCKSQRPSNAFQLKYCIKLTAEEIAENLGYDVRTIYKQIDNDMDNFGIWLAHDCPGATIFEQIRAELETSILSDYNKRYISIVDEKSWKTLRSDYLKKFSQHIQNSPLSIKALNTCSSFFITVNDPCTVYTEQ